ncbi:MAG: hypothetical protein ACHQC8_02400 [Solirubrobacterales bacterium]
MAPKRDTFAENGVGSYKPSTLRSPAWEKPAWQTMRGAPEGWEKVVKLRQVSMESKDPEMSAPAMIRYREKVERKLRERLLTREGRGQFVKRYFGHDDMPFHEEGMDAAWDGGKTVVLWPTEHAKSTKFCVEFPIMSLANDPNAPHTICCVNEPEAKLRLSAVRTILENNHELLRDYPWIAKPRRGTWGRTEINVDGRDTSELSPSVWACGRGNGAIKGHRAKTIFDDLEGKRSHDSSDYRAQMTDWFFTEAVRAYETEGETERPLLLVCGTPYDVDSFYFGLADREGWKLIRRPYRYSDGRLIWPRLARKIEGFKKEMDRREFAIAMELDPRGGDHTIVSLKDLDELTEQLLPMPEDAGMVVALDPAAGQGPDYVGITVVRWRWDLEDDLPYFNVYSPLRYRKEIYEQVLTCRRLAAKFGNVPVLFEVNGRQKQDYGSLFRRFAPEVKLVEHWTNELNKLDEYTGMTVIRTMARKGRIAIWANPSDEEEVDGKKALLIEIRDLGQSNKDHLVASLWFVFQHAYERHRTLKQSQMRSNYATTEEGLVIPGRPAYNSRRGNGLYFGGRPAAGAGNKAVRFQS